MSASCRRIRRALLAFAARDLDADAAARVRAHLRDCNACRIEAAAAARAAQALQEARDLPEACDPAWFAGMHQSILEAAAATPTAPAVARPARRRTASMVAAAALFAAGLAVSAVPSRSSGLHVRPPIRIAGEAPDAAGNGRASMLPLGQEQWLGPHHGLMGRLELRSLEQLETEGFEVRPPSQDRLYPSAARSAPAAAPAAGTGSAESRR